MNKLNELKMGTIGIGKMASAIVKGITESNFIKEENILSSKATTNNLEELSARLGIKIITDNKEVVDFSDIIILAVKPNQAKDVLSEIKENINSSKILVSVAAGLTTEKIENSLECEIPVIRVMPNTPVLVKEGMCGICGGKYATAEQLNMIKEIFDKVGKTVIVEEYQMDIVTAISGSGPAFFYKVINDIARAGEKLGLDYEKSLLLSIQSALGSAKMALNRTSSMEELISNVATKGGCTRVGVDCMVDNKTEEIFYNVIKSTAQKSSELGKG